MPKTPISSRTEFIQDIALPNADAAYQLPTQGGLLPSDRYIERIRLQFEGRFTMPASGNPSAVLADAPYSIIERVKIEGQHRLRNTRDTIYDLRAAELRELNKIYYAGNSTGISTPSSLTLTANATNDVRFTLDLPFAPENMPRAEMLKWILDAPNYDSLAMTIFFADVNSVFSGQTNPPTITAYGSASGNAKIRVSGVFAQAGVSKFAGFIPGRVCRYFTEVASGDILNTVSGSRLFNIPRGYKIRSLLLKTGAKGTGVTGGNNAYASLSNTILSNLQINQGLGRFIRKFPDFYSIQADIQSRYGNLPDTGYALIDFAPQGVPGEMLDTSGLVAGPSGDVDLYVSSDTASGSNQAALIVYQEARYTPSQIVQGRLMPLVRN